MCKIFYKFMNEINHEKKVVWSCGPSSVVTISNVVIVEESFGSVSRWLKSSCPPSRQAILHIISTWPNSRSRGLKLLSILPKCRRLLAVPVRMYVSSHAETLQRLEIPFLNCCRM
ncbi:hypothetical protein DAPPUDRAFT_107650 [Daphnia pulex]|uniref:Uncharacterized protein n=1 Tax=Daphnia pulex TaxID=6669 RepID=E9GXU1_DAPPU|nr:hypothetical protein DAPPUDRAFT_107650 [Daphnia pulex]|eukprot:EFX75758.1 hypothetical protein DAPPUDRAFT_107650 [Daphnia pulex]